LAANYIQLKDNDQNKGETIYIDRRPKELGNIAVFINSTGPMNKISRPNKIVLRGVKETCIRMCNKINSCRGNVID
jgi:hypothetical protein